MDQLLWNLVTSTILETRLLEDDHTDTYRLPLDFWFFEVIGHVYTVQCEVLYAKNEG